MKVYAILENYGHEGQRLRGVFSSEESAVRFAIKRAWEKRNSTDWSLYYDLEEEILNQPGLEWTSA